MSSVISKIVNGNPGERGSPADLYLTSCGLAGRAFINGFPGAGNVLAAQVAMRLLEPQSAPLPPELGAPFGRTYNAVHQRLTKAMTGRLAAGTPYFQPTGRGDANFCITLREREFVVVKNLPLRIHLNTLVHSTHEYPDRTTGAFYEAEGYTALPVVRHPLDLIVSFARKHIGSTEDIFADRAVRAKIIDEKWLAATCHLLAEFYEHVPADALKYEDAISAPLSYVADIGKRLGVRIEAPEPIAAIIGVTEFRPGHFNKPSTGKWRDFFAQNELDAVPSRLWDVFEKFGYHRPETYPLNGLPLQSDMNEASWHDVLALLVTFDPLLLSDLYAVDLATAWAGRHLVVATDADLAKHMVDGIAEAQLGT